MTKLSSILTFLPSIGNICDSARFAETRQIRGGAKLFSCDVFRSGNANTLEGANNFRILPVRNFAERNFACKLLIATSNAHANSQEIAWDSINL